MTKKIDQNERPPQSSAELSEMTQPFGSHSPYFQKRRIPALAYCSKRHKVNPFQPSAPLDQELYKTNLKKLCDEVTGLVQHMITSGTAHQVAAENSQTESITLLSIKEWFSVQYNAITKLLQDIEGIAIQDGLSWRDHYALDRNIQQLNKKAMQGMMHLDAPYQYLPLLSERHKRQIILPDAEILPSAESENNLDPMNIALREDFKQWIDVIFGTWQRQATEGSAYHAYVKALNATVQYLRWSQYNCDDEFHPDHYGEKYPDAKKIIDQCLEHLDSEGFYGKLHKLSVPKLYETISSKNTWVDVYTALLELQQNDPAVLALDIYVQLAEFDSVRKNACDKLLASKNLPTFETVKQELNKEANPKLEQLYNKIAAAFQKITQKYDQGEVQTGTIVFAVGKIKKLNQQVHVRTDSDVAQFTEGLNALDLSKITGDDKQRLRGYIGLINKTDDFNTLLDLTIDFWGVIDTLREDKTIHSDVEMKTGVTKTIQQIECKISQHILEATGLNAEERDNFVTLNNSFKQRQILLWADHLRFIKAFYRTNEISNQGEARIQRALSLVIPYLRFIKWVMQPCRKIKVHPVRYDKNNKQLLSQIDEILKQMNDNDTDQLDDKAGSVALSFPLLSELFKDCFIKQDTPNCVQTKLTCFSQKIQQLLNTISRVHEVYPLSLNTITEIDEHIRPINQTFQLKGIKQLNTLVNLLNSRSVVEFSSQEHQGLREIGTISPPYFFSSSRNAVFLPHQELNTEPKQELNTEPTQEPNTNDSDDDIRFIL